MSDIFADNRLNELFMQLLDRPEPRDRAYVYRLKDGKPLKPALFSDQPFAGLLEYLRDEYGSAQYRIMIRRGETMLLTGEFGVAAPSTWRARTPSL